MAFYRGWRAVNPTTPAAAFAQKTLEGWEVGASTELLDEHEVKKVLDEDHFSVLTRDDFMIALAFAQLVLEGRVDPYIRTQALHSIQRQATEVVISFRGWVGPKERRRRLAKMREAIELARQLEG